MPNYIQNRLTFKGSNSKIKELFNLVKGENSLFDFNKIIPMPKKAIDSFGDYGDNPYWYSWSIENWGVKWNAGETDDLRNSENVRYFQTAWNCPYNVILELASKYPELEIELMWADEDASYNTGLIVFKGGKEYSVHQPDGGSMEGYDFYFELHPDRKEDYIFVDGNHEYKEE